MKPLCTGDANGVITLNVTNGVGPYQFDWGSGFIPSNTQGASRQVCTPLRVWMPNCVRVRLR
ncbi:MAG: SprB repeat-containing protein [Lewinellaceae bacterium]|nr:SprB repeat-containing protein [Lewinellaceae bacterium]